MMSYVDQELTVEDMLADPIVQIIMRYDGISASDVRHTIDRVARHRACRALVPRIEPGLLQPRYRDRMRVAPTGAGINAA